MNPTNANDCEDFAKAAGPGLWHRRGRQALAAATTADLQAAQAVQALPAPPWREAEWPLTGPIPTGALPGATPLQAHVLCTDQQIAGVAWSARGRAAVADLLRAPWGELLAGPETYAQADPTGDMLLGCGRVWLGAGSSPVTEVLRGHGALLHAARMGLVQQEGLRGWIAAVPVRLEGVPEGVHYSPWAYVQQVEAGALVCPLLTPALEAGAHVLGVHRGSWVAGGPWPAGGSQEEAAAAPCAHGPLALVMWLNPARR